MPTTTRVDDADIDMSELLMCSLNQSPTSLYSENICLNGSGSFALVLDVLNECIRLFAAIPIINYDRCVFPCQSQGDAAPHSITRRPCDYRDSSLIHYAGSPYGLA